jgi:putative copper resistance protein D
VTIEQALIVARFAHYASLLVLFGVSLFPSYAGLDGTRLGWLRRTTAAFAAAALLTAAGWYALTAASMAGGFGAAVNRDVLVTVAGSTSFGKVWIAHAGLILVVLLLSPFPAGRKAVSWLAGLSLAAMAATGHGPAPGGAAGAAHAVADAVHLLAAGWWVGGLWALAVVLRRESGEALSPVLAGFSGVGGFAVAALVLSGVVNAWFLVGSPERLVATEYGRLLLLKLALFLGMAGLAAANRFWITPRIAAPDPEARWLRRLRRQVWLEQALGAGVVAIVSVLGMIQPAAG